MSYMHKITDSADHDVRLSVSKIYLMTEYSYLMRSVDRFI